MRLLYAVGRLNSLHMQTKVQKAAIRAPSLKSSRRMKKGTRRSIMRKKSKVRTFRLEYCPMFLIVPYKTTTRQRKDLPDRSLPLSLVPMHILQSPQSPSMQANGQTCLRASPIGHLTLVILIFFPIWKRQSLTNALPLYLHYISIPVPQYTLSAIHMRKASSPRLIFIYSTHPPRVSSMPKKLV